jgi:hypothetical protein
VSTIGNTRRQASAILLTDDESLLARVREPGVQSVIFTPMKRAPWEELVKGAVERRDFVIERCSLNVECSMALPQVLEARLSQEGLPFEIRLALIDDLSALADRLAAITGCRGLMVRLFTEAPTEHCGFHVDTVPPGCPPFGLLKVYNGPGTLYVDPDDVVDMNLFYGYLGRRERLARTRNQAIKRDHEAEAQRLRAELLELDATLPFLRPAAAVHEVPAGATVAFRHLDVGKHWFDHRKEIAWIHCSPMTGLTRLLANFTPLDGRVVRPR